MPHGAAGAGMVRGGSIAGLLLFAQTAACTYERVVGESAAAPADSHAVQPRADADAAIPVAAAVAVTAVRAQPGETLVPDPPIVGDLDGDGFADFALSAWTSMPELEHEADPRVYLFYGRSEYSDPQLTTAAADAVFEGVSRASAAGDLDGDGRDDLILEGGSGRGRFTQFVFGSAERLTRNVELAATGARWHAIPFPREVGRTFGTTLLAQSVGDTNCDGKDDLVVVSTAPRQASAIDLEVVHHAHIVYGQPQPWPSGTWDFSWGAAAFDRGLQHSAAGSYLIEPPGPAGDLDGDGCADLVSSDSTHARQHIFYGEPGRWTGTLTARDADAVIEVEGFDYSAYGTKLGDADGDGLDDLAIGWNDDYAVDIVYGSRPRWSGIVTAPERLRIFAADGHGTIGVPSVRAGDIDGDGRAEIVIASPQYGMGAHGDYNLGGAVFALRGTEFRRTGEHQLVDDDVLVAGSPAHQRSLGAAISGGRTGVQLGSALSMAGDVDGDGNLDILTSARGAGPAPAEGGAIVLITGVSASPQ